MGSKRKLATKPEKVSSPRCRHLGLLRFVNLALQSYEAVSFSSRSKYVSFLVFSIELGQVP